MLTHLKIDDKRTPHPPPKSHQTTEFNPRAEQGIGRWLFPIGRVKRENGVLKSPDSIGSIINGTSTLFNCPTYRCVLVAVLLILTVTVPAESATPVPHVVVTIKPIHALVSGVMDGVGVPHLLLQGGESPHNYSLQPSQVKQLHVADLLIWVDPSVETFLEKTITTLTDRVTLLRLLNVQGLALLKVRKGGVWETHRHDDSHHEALDVDPHIWLDPHNAKVIAQTVARTLSQLDKVNATYYMANATRLTKHLEQLDQSLTHQLAPVKDLPYAVFHDAYQYFEHRYGLTVVGAVNLSPETRPGAKHLHQLRARLKNQQVLCVFSEPQFESALVATLIENTSVQRGTLDPLGAELVGGAGVYVALLHNLAKSLKQCLLNNEKAQ